MEPRDATARIEAEAGPGGMCPDARFGTKISVRRHRAIDRVGTHGPSALLENPADAMGPRRAVRSGERGAPPPIPDSWPDARSFAALPRHASGATGSPTRSGSASGHPASARRGAGRCRTAQGAERRAGEWASVPQAPFWQRARTPPPILRQLSNPANEPVAPSEPPLTTRASSDWPQQFSRRRKLPAGRSVICAWRAP
jgi:hypothetical protein